MNLYFGDIPICYSHSTAMALQAAGYDFRSDYLEAIMVMGNGATLVKKDDRYPLVFFDNGMPDESISHCLQIFSFRLAAVRSLYLSQFLKGYDPVRADLKEKIAMLFSQAYLDSRQEAYSSLADTLMEIAQLDGQFRDLCLQCIKG